MVSTSVKTPAMGIAPTCQERVREESPESATPWPEFGKKQVTAPSLTVVLVQVPVIAPRFVGILGTMLYGIAAVNPDGAATAYWALSAPDADVIEKANGVLQRT